MATMSYREQVMLANTLGATYKDGRWAFPTTEAQQEFHRRAIGLEWTDKQRTLADYALRQQCEILKKEKKNVE